MANNPYTNKVEYAGQTLIDLTGDTATAADVAKGKIFHLASGAQAIGTLEGGGGAGKNDVNFYDYDGTIVKSYSAVEFANLSALPDNPSHDGLTAQGWNWTLADAKAYVASYGKLEIGQMYITDDGKTRIYIRLEDGRLAPYLGIAINGTATVEWGDGQTSTVTGSSTSTVVNTQHTYASAGEFVIKIAVSGSMALVGDSSQGSQLLWKNSTSGGSNLVYKNAIQKIEIGANTSISDYAFQSCYSLTSIMVPSGITSIGSGTFNSCTSLTSITIPSGVTSVGGSFYSCYSLASVVIPSSATSISNSAFQYCYSLASVTIPNSVKRIGGSAFNSCSSLASIAIPSGITSIGTSTFSSCASLASITMSSGATSIGDSAFRNCLSLTSITVPSGVTSIGTNTFASCYGLGYIKFESTTPPPVSNSNAWTNIPTDCVIYVPRGSLSEYTSASNYPSSSDYTYVEY